MSVWEVMITYIEKKGKVTSRQDYQASRVIYGYVTMSKNEYIEDKLPIFNYIQLLIDYIFIYNFYKCEYVKLNKRNKETNKTK